MAIRQPVMFQAGNYAPPLLRAYQTLPFLQDPASAQVKPLSGVIPRGSGLDWQISQSGSTVTVGGGASIVAGTEASAQSGYEAINDAAMSFTIPAAPTSQTRLDRIGIRVRDSAYSGAAADGDVVLVSGTPASSNPQLPTPPANFYELLQVSTTGNGTPVVTPTWRYTAGVAGIRPARGGTVDDGLPPAFAGQYRDLAGALQRGDGPGGTWRTVAQAVEWSQFTPVLYYRGGGTDTPVALGNGGTAIGRYLVQGKVMHLRIVIRGAAGYNGGYGQLSSRLPPGFTSAAAEETQILCKVNTQNVNGNGVVTGIWEGVAYIPPNSQRIEPYFPNAYNDCRLSQFRAATSAAAGGTGVPQIINSGSFPDLGILDIQGTIEIQ